MSTYNGWKNYATWNIALWLNNDEGLYHLVTENGEGLTYESFAKDYLCEFSSGTPDDINWLDESLDYDALTELLQEATA